MINGELPKGWMLTPLGEAADNLDGKRVPLKMSDRDQRHGKYPYYGASGIIDYIDDFLFDGDHLLVAEDGANLLARSTPIAFLASGRFWVNNHAHVLSFNGRASLNYLQRYLCSIDISRYVTGSAQPKLNQKNLDRIEIPLPSLSEQKRIADILDKADAIRRKRQVALKEIETLSLAAYRHQFGHPIAANDVVPLSECVTILSGGTPSKSNDSYWNGDFPWVSPKDMKVDYIFDAEDHVTDLAFQETTLKKLPASSILIVVRGMILAHTIPVALTDVPVAINQDMKALIPNEGYDPAFLCWSLKAAHNFILGKVATAAHGTKRLEVKHLASFPIPNATLSEQRQFARIAQKIRDSRNRLASSDPEDLFNSIVQRAFKGEL